MNTIYLLCEFLSWTRLLGFITFQSFVPTSSFFFSYNNQVEIQFEITQRRCICIKRCWTQIVFYIAIRLQINVHSISSNKINSWLVLQWTKNHLVYLEDYYVCNTSIASYLVIKCKKRISTFIAYLQKLGYLYTLWIYNNTKYI